ncbi:MAG: ATP-binding protein [Spirochaetia bacterium]|nr:ATP-binding protein [Spirochaetia bacterium]
MILSRKRRIHSAWWYPIFTTVLPGAVIPIGLALIFNTFYQSWRWDHEPFHSLVEGIGSFAAVLLAFIIISMRKSDELSPSYIWIASTLMGMGLLDGFHAGVRPGIAFVWLHSIATFVGGLTFAFVVIPERISALKKIENTPYFIAAASIITGILSVIFPDWIPAMVKNQKFTTAAEFLNITGGLGFLIAWAHFSWSKHFRSSKEERVLLANHCILFGTAGLLFHFSVLWDATWWLWHILRLFAYLVILWFFVEIYIRNVKKIRDNRDQIESMATRLQSVLNNVADGIIIINKNAEIELMNPSAEKIFGYNESETSGKNVNMLVSEPFNGSFVSYLKSTQEKNTGPGKEITGKKKDGSEFPIDLAVSTMKISGERKFIGLVRDITERKRIENMKNEFISTVSHELRTPLTSIRGSIRLLTGGALGKLPEEIRNLLNIASNNTERLLLLINDILDIQKIETGKMDFQFQLFSIKEFLEESLSINQSYADPYGINFKLTVPQDDFHINGDRNRLLQVMDNLISNAVKFSPENSSIEIKAEKNQDLIRIEVTDHGTGIPDHFKPFLFDKFTQEDSSDTRKKGGTGLGLSITKLILEKHNGYIDFFSGNDSGTTFYFELPFPPQKDIVA